MKKILIYIFSISATVGGAFLAATISGVGEGEFVYDNYVQDGVYSVTANKANKLPAYSGGDASGVSELPANLTPVAISIAMTGTSVIVRPSTNMETGFDLHPTYTTGSQAMTSPADQNQPIQGMSSVNTLLMPMAGSTIALSGTTLVAQNSLQAELKSEDLFRWGPPGGGSPAGNTPIAHPIPVLFVLALVYGLFLTCRIVITTHRNNSTPGSNDLAPGSNGLAPGSNDSAPGSNDSAPGSNDLASGSNGSALGSNDSAPGSNNFTLGSRFNVVKVKEN